MCIHVCVYEEVMVKSMCSESVGSLISTTRMVFLFTLISSGVDVHIVPTHIASHIDIQIATCSW